MYWGSNATTYQSNFFSRQTDRWTDGHIDKHKGTEKNEIMDFRCFLLVVDIVVVVVVLDALSLRIDDYCSRREALKASKLGKEKNGRNERGLAFGL